MLTNKVKVLVAIKIPSVHSDTILFYCLKLGLGKGEGIPRLGIKLSRTELLRFLWFALTQFILFFKTGVGERGGYSKVGNQTLTNKPHQQGKSSDSKSSY